MSRAGEPSGRRLLATMGLALSAAAGFGLLTAAITMQAPEPPQPDAQQAAFANGGKPLPPALPTRVEIPAIAVSAEIIGVGVDAKGELQVPSLDRPMQTGWYRGGVTPGEAGNAVIVGHVDSEKIGAAVFFNLGLLQPGDAVNVLRADGRIATFKVDYVKSFLKTEFPAELVYGGSQVAGLRLITCGGQLDKQNKNYLSNVVAFATLTS